MQKGNAMKVRHSWVMALIPALFMLVGFAFIAPLKAPGFDLAPETLAPVLLVPFGIGVILGLPLMLVHWAEFYGDRVRTRGKRWGPWQVLKPGERFVICRNQVQIQRPDGSLKRTGLSKWASAKRDWRRIEHWLPTIDAIRSGRY